MLLEKDSGNKNIKSMILTVGSEYDYVNSFVIPNVLNMDGSFIVNDRTGIVYEKTSDKLQNNGYKVYRLSKNCIYDPIQNMQKDSGEPDSEKIKLFSELLKTYVYGQYNIVPGGFYDSAFLSYIHIIIFYIFETNKENERTFREFISLATDGSDYLYASMKKRDRDLDDETESLRNFRTFILSTEKTQEDVIDKVRQFFEEIEEKYKYNEKQDQKKIFIKDVLREKTAVFITEDGSYESSFLQQMMYLDVAYNARESIMNKEHLIPVMIFSGTLKEEDGWRMGVEKYRLSELTDKRYVKDIQTVLTEAPNFRTGKEYKTFITKHSVLPKADCYETVIIFEQFYSNMLSLYGEKHIPVKTPKDLRIKENSEMVLIKYKPPMICEKYTEQDAGENNG